MLGNGGNDTLDGGTGDDLLDGGARQRQDERRQRQRHLRDQCRRRHHHGARTLPTPRTWSSRRSPSIWRFSRAGLIEHAILTGATAINATGNDKDNELTGNSGANKLDGGAGADALTGGNGADIYTVDDFGDKVVETTGGAAGGIDLVNSSIDFTLGAECREADAAGRLRRHRRHRQHAQQHHHRQ